MSMRTPIPIAALTDEFSPDLNVALTEMQNLGLECAELRVVNGRNILALTNRELEDVARQLAARGMTAVSIASPLLKYELAGGPPLDTRFQQDVFGARYTHTDHSTLLARAFEVARRLDARLIRVFSFWRTVDPAACVPRVASALYELAEEARTHDVLIGLENEHACNVGTGEELGQMLRQVPHPHLVAIWDPANALVVGETPYPDGYSHIPFDRIAHVHAKDCVVVDHAPTWGPLGEMAIDWKGQIDRLVRDGYRGAISLETHWTGPSGDTLMASRICARTLLDLTRMGS